MPRSTSCLFFVFFVLATTSLTFIMAPIRNIFSLALSAITLANAEYIIPDAYSACSSIANSFKHENVTINFAQHVPKGTNLTLDQTPPLQLCTRPSQVVPVDICRVAMYVATSNRSGITMEAWLPTNWTGRYLSTGNGGLSGCIQYEDIAYGTSFGFAAVGANNGHNGTRGTAFENNGDVVIDFAWRSLYTETIIGKAITTAYYSKTYTKSYYLGCSTGGRQGFKMAQDFPDLFDGIVAGAPAFAFNNLTSWSGHFFPITGTNTSDTFLPASKWALVSADVLRQCDALDGVTDGIIEDPTLCHYKPVTLQCLSTAKNTSSCLTAKQVETVTAIFADYYGENGALIFPRIQPGAEIADVSLVYGGTAFPYTADWFQFAVLNDSTWDPATLNSTYAAIASEINPGDIETWSGDLSAFKAHGGKLLHYHGQKDSIITSENSPRYYEHVATTMGLAPQELDSFYRFFRIGGMDHCTGGNGAWSLGQRAVSGNPYLDPQHNVLMRMVKWVETGASAAPVSVTGVKFVNDTVSLGVDFERKHCKYPLRNKCVDPENYKNPESWKCVE